jgi:hypothetical protein
VPVGGSCHPDEDAAERERPHPVDKEVTSRGPSGSRAESDFIERRPIPPAGDRSLHPTERLTTE